MSTKKQYLTFASGWLKYGKAGQYISVVANNNKSNIKLFAQLEDGTILALDNFAVFFNTNKDNSKAPDARFVFTQE